MKLDRVRGTGQPIEIAEEFRMLTLQVIGEAILSLSAEESDRVFPHLYLPIMEEGNRRSLEPWRAFMPLPALTQRARVRRLNAYIIGVSESCCFYVDATLLLIFPLLNTAGLLKERWGKRQAGQKSVRPDIVDRIMDAIDPAEWGEAAQRQLCYEIKVRSPCVAAQARRASDTFDCVRADFYFGWS